MFLSVSFQSDWSMWIKAKFSSKAKVSNVMLKFFFNLIINRQNWMREREMEYIWFSLFRSSVMPHCFLLSDTIFERSLCLCLFLSLYFHYNMVYERGVIYFFFHIHNVIKMIILKDGLFISRLLLAVWSDRV